MEVNKADFGNHFKWGIASSAYQVEGAHREDGRGWSIWDEFTNKKQAARNKATANQANQFYYHYPYDLDLLKWIGAQHFRYSIAWPRILPDGKGLVNKKGLDFYKRLVDACLERNIQPWLTLYHWDLPNALEKDGGWMNRSIIEYFANYVETCVQALSDRVKHWMVMNEPNVFTGAGYGLGLHAPGRYGLNKFLSSLHHAVLAQGEGFRIIKDIDPKAMVGSTFSTVPVDQARQNENDEKAANRIHSLINRICLDPLLGYGYPTESVPFLKNLERYIKSGDEEKLSAPADFIGIQPYTREVVKNAWYIPYIHALRISPKKRKVPLTAMGWEFYGEAIYRVLSWLRQYQNLPPVYVTENGLALNDHVVNGEVDDHARVEYFKKSLSALLRAKKEGAPVEGYFAWTLTDNFEWAEGYDPRFGLFHVDFNTQKRTVKASGNWWRRFLNQGY